MKTEKKVERKRERRRMRRQFLRRKIPTQAQQYCTCLRATYQKANRVIAVNELYVLLSDQNCECDTSEEVREGKRRERKPEYLSAYTQHKY